MMQYKKTERGFGFYEFKDRYGFECSLQESSLVDPSIWLGADKSSDGKPVGVIGELVNGHVLDGRMHLSQEQVAELLPLLHYFVETGYLPTPDDIEI